MKYVVCWVVKSGSKREMGSESTTPFALVFCMCIRRSSCHTSWYVEACQQAMSLTTSHPFPIGRYLRVPLMVYWVVKSFSYELVLPPRTKGLFQLWWHSVIHGNEAKSLVSPHTATSSHRKSCGLRGLSGLVVPIDSLYSVTDGSASE